MKDRQSASILIVDDMPDKLLVYQSVLEELEENVITVRSGSEALREVLRHDFAVILLDVNMPGMDGFETAQLIRQRRRSAHTPIIFLTAFTDEVRIAQGYATGAVDYISTPVVPEILQAKVRVFTDLYRLGQQVARQAEEGARREAAEEAARRSEFLAETSRALANSLDFAATFNRLASLGVPYVADVCILCVTNDKGSQLRDSALSWLDPRDDRVHFQRGDPVRLAPWLLAQLSSVLDSGLRESQELAGFQPLLAEVPAVDSESAIEDQFAPPEVQALIALPLRARGRNLGVIGWGIRTARRESSASEIELVDELAGRGSIALDNAILVRDMQENDRRKTEFLAMLAHELRNPLAPIRNAHEILRHLKSNQPELVMAREVIDRQLTHLVRLVDDLLDVSRITRGKIRLQHAVLNIADVVGIAVETSRPMIDTCDHELTVELPRQPLFVHGDKSRLVQVFSNLLNNAAKFTPPGGRIILLVEDQGDEVIVRVRDNGAGIPPEMLSQIFDMFTQVNQTHDRPTSGLGVGLTLVQRLVELHNGSVQAVSEGVALGSEFVVRLPRHDPPQTSDLPAAEPRVVADAPPRRRVLLVDDNVDAARTLSLLLESDQHEVELAHTGPDALVAAASFLPDVVLLDIGLPGLDGYEVAKRLRATQGTHDVLLIALTGYGQPEDRHRAQLAGFDHFLVKPMNPDVLQEMLYSGTVTSK